MVHDSTHVRPSGHHGVPGCPLGLPVVTHLQHRCEPPGQRALDQGRPELDEQAHQRPGRLELCPGHVQRGGAPAQVEHDDHVYAAQAISPRANESADAPAPGCWFRHGKRGALLALAGESSRQRVCLQPLVRPRARRLLGRRPLLYRGSLAHPGCASDGGWGAFCQLFLLPLPRAHRGGARLLVPGEERERRAVQSRIRQGDPRLRLVLYRDNGHCRIRRQGKTSMFWYPKAKP